jgi:hypothetical protein
MPTPNFSGSMLESRGTNKERAKLKAEDFIFFLFVDVFVATHGYIS